MPTEIHVDLHYLAKQSKITENMLRTNATLPAVDEVSKLLLICEAVAVHVSIETSLLHSPDSSAHQKQQNS